MTITLHKSPFAFILFVCFLCVARALIRLASANSGVGNVSSGRLSTPFSETQELKGIQLMFGSSEATPSHALAERLLDEIDSGTFNAKSIINQRNMSAHLAKMLRLRRADGEEFAVVYTASDFHIWSSVQADERPGLNVDIYNSDKARNSNLGCMEKLRCPNKRRGTTVSMRGNLLFLRLKTHERLLCLQVNYIFRNLRRRSGYATG